MDEGLADGRVDDEAALAVTVTAAAAAVVAMAVMVVVVVIARATAVRLAEGPQDEAIAAEGVHDAGVLEAGDGEHHAGEVAG